MLSWSLGGYPSPNLELVKHMQDHPSQTISGSLLEIATNRYGTASAPEVVKAWDTFSAAFTEFPYGLGIYTAPVNYGPYNPLYADPTGKQTTMLGFPFDDIAMDEMQLARQMYKITKEDSRIGFEASNHYYYFPLDFVEKVINCRYILVYYIIEMVPLLWYSRFLCGSAISEQDINRARIDEN